MKFKIGDYVIWNNMECRVEDIIRAFDRYLIRILSSNQKIYCNDDELRPDIAHHIKELLDIL